MERIEVEDATEEISIEVHAPGADGFQRATWPDGRSFLVRHPTDEEVAQGFDDGVIMEPDTEEGRVRVTRAADEWLNRKAREQAHLNHE